MVEKIQIDSEDGEFAEARLESLARDLAEEINTAPSERREQLREMVVHLVRDEVRIAPPAIDRSVGGGAGVFNPFAIGIPLALVGGVLTILFPPVGLLLLAAAGMTMAWGILSVLVSRGGD